MFQDDFRFSWPEVLNLTYNIFLILLIFSSHIDGHHEDPTKKLQQLSLTHCAVAISIRKEELE